MNETIMALILATATPGGGFPVYGDAFCEVVNAQATIGLFNYWAVFAAGQRDLENSRMLNDEFGVGYEDECLGVSISYRRDYTTDRDVPPSTSVFLRFNLKTGQPEKPSDLFPRHVFTTP